MRIKNIVSDEFGNISMIQANSLEINNLSSNLLSIGQKLLVPKVGSKTYTVQVGDTLYKIARENNTTVTEIINLNELPTTNLSIGQVLYLP